MSGSAAGFRETRPEEISRNPFGSIGTDWMLVTAGGHGSWNTMTAAWGAMGHLWERNVCFAFVRPQRHTWTFMENNPLFSLSFFPPRYRDALEFCGSHSGRDVDKAAATGLEPFEIVEGCVGFTQADLVIACRKIHSQDVDPAGFLDGSIAGLYPQRDYHRIYVGEVVRALVR